MSGVGERQVHGERRAWYAQRCGDVAEWLKGHTAIELVVLWGVCFVLGGPTFWPLLFALLAGIAFGLFTLLNILGGHWETEVVALSATHLRVGDEQYPLDSLKSISWHGDGLILERMQGVEIHESVSAGSDERWAFVVEVNERLSERGSASDVPISLRRLQENVTT